TVTDSPTEAAHNLNADPEALAWARAKVERVRVPAPVRAELETGRLPAHWWVSLTPVAIATVDGGDRT
ncbi:hypothetical protein AB0C10_37650, partial [Microbispora amethystogenes]|uniref:hypothetical protein n=1 Tax=Microbispora amethystogenes TaxID=1427754 RepID=UPI0033FE0908